MDRDRRLAEMMGLCKHRGIWGGQGWVCYKCKEHIRLQNSHGELDPDFSTPEWRAKLMDWAVEQGWWEAFYRKTWRDWYRKQDAWSVGREAKYVVHLWRNLPALVNEYRRER